MPKKICPDNRTVSSGLYYAGDSCTSDCSGHEAGATWAEENQIEDPEDCGGNSDSFIEGCRTFVEKNWRKRKRLMSMKIYKMPPIRFSTLS